LRSLSLKKRELEGDIDDCREDNLINDDEYKKYKDLFNFTFYLLDKYLDALYKLEKSGGWRTRFKRNH
jgi:hypothetical protein